MTYRDNDEDERLPIENEAGSDKAGKLMTCHRPAVKGYKNRRVLMSGAGFHLEFYTS